jgi:hypothetical protein
MIFAGINARIYTGTFANSLNKRDRLINPHRAAGIMTILLEIKDQQNTRASRPRIDLRPRAGYRA